PSSGAWLLPSEPQASLNTVAFYSVSAQHAGTKGMNMGRAIIYQVSRDIGALNAGMKTFCTLSPVPGYLAWLRSPAGAAALHCDLGDVSSVSVGTLRDALHSCGVAVPTPACTTSELLHSMASYLSRSPHAAQPSSDAERELALRATAWCRAYLCSVDARSGAAVDKVAHFHLGNGAQLQRILWGADASAQGLAQSGGIMVNYVYSSSGMGEASVATLAERSKRYSAAPADVVFAQQPLIVGV
ncbi:hypothetical protein EON66_02405, partial [archaeon]